MAEYMLDTVVFNRVLEREIEPSLLPQNLFATHAQRDEIERTPDSFRRQFLLRIFELVAPTKVPTASAVWDLSSWDEAHWPTEDSVFDEIVAEVTDLDQKAGRSVSNPHVRDGIRRDALIAETAVRANLTLVTDDPRLAMVVREVGGRALSFDEFLKLGDAR